MNLEKFNWGPSSNDYKTQMISEIFSNKKRGVFNSPF